MIDYNILTVSMHTCTNSLDTKRNRALYLLLEFSRPNNVGDATLTFPLILSIQKAAPNVAEKY